MRESFLLSNSCRSVTGENYLFPWEENGKKGSGRNRREEEDLLWEENGKKGVEGIEWKKRICCGKRMGRREWKEKKGRRGFVVGREWEEGRGRNRMEEEDLL
jgi:hypothetical protein